MTAPDARALADDCEKYAEIIEGIIVVANDWRPGDSERREPRETLLKAAAALRASQPGTVSREVLLALARRHANNWNCVDRAAPSMLEDFGREVIAFLALPADDGTKP